MFHRVYLTGPLDEKYIRMMQGFPVLTEEAIQDLQPSKNKSLYEHKGTVLRILGNSLSDLNNVTRQLGRVFRGKVLTQKVNDEMEKFEDEIENIVKLRNRCKTAMDFPGVITAIIFVKRYVLYKRNLVLELQEKN